MTGFLYRLILDVEINADSQKDADEIVSNLNVDDMNVEVWSSEYRFKGTVKEVDEW